MIVLADADLERAANAAVYYATNNAGQVCLSVERVYVEDSIHDPFVELVVDKVRQLRQGPPAGPGSVDLGAITNPPQVDLLDRHVTDARERGARVLVGGVRPAAPSQFYPPTVLVDVDHEMQVMKEESFGPLIPIMRVRDAEHALALANDSRYGLGASVFGAGTGRASTIAEQLRSGTVAINDAQINYGALEVPMGGVKESGIGTRHGPDGIRKYTVAQTVMTNSLPLRRDPHFYPYRARASKLIEAGIRAWWGWRRV
jgi:acyl-CoA reductase-like NAD-dependent aldehyde dehydrogenase